MTPTQRTLTARILTMRGLTEQAQALTIKPVCGTNQPAQDAQ